MQPPAAATAKKAGSGTTGRKASTAGASSWRAVARRRSQSRPMNPDRPSAALDRRGPGLDVQAHDQVADAIGDGGVGLLEDLQRCVRQLRMRAPEPDPPSMLLE